MYKQEGYSSVPLFRLKVCRGGCGFKFVMQFCFYTVDVCHVNRCTVEVSGWGAFAKLCVKPTV
jgi:hypothetical protein